MCRGWDWVGAGAGYLCVCGECLVVSFPKNYILYGSWEKTIQLCKDVVEELKHSWFFSVFCPHCIQAHCVPVWVNQTRLPLLKVSRICTMRELVFLFSSFCSFPTVSRVFQLQHMLPTTGIYICSSEDDAVFQKSVTGAGPFHQAVQVCHLYNFNTPGLNRILNFAEACCSSRFPWFLVINQMTSFHFPVYFVDWITHQSRALKQHQTATCQSNS